MMLLSDRKPGQLLQRISRDQNAAVFGGKGFHRRTEGFIFPVFRKNIAHLVKRLRSGGGLMQHQLIRL